jgi:hypothetical protein
VSFALISSFSRFKPRPKPCTVAPKPSTLASLRSSAAAHRRLRRAHRRSRVHTTMAARSSVDGPDLIKGIPLRPAHRGPVDHAHSTVHGHVSAALGCPEPSPSKSTAEISLPLKSNVQLPINPSLPSLFCKNNPAVFNITKMPFHP